MIPTPLCTLQFQIFESKAQPDITKDGLLHPEQLLIYNNSELVVKGKIQDFAKL
jgi:hypothetical protein